MAENLHAATIALLPQLFGPTSTVSPAAGSITVWACDMKFVNSMRFNTAKSRRDLILLGRRDAYPTSQSYRHHQLSA